MHVIRGVISGQRSTICNRHGGHPCLRGRNVSDAVTRSASKGGGKLGFAVCRSLNMWFLVCIYVNKKVCISCSKRSGLTLSPPGNMFDPPRRRKQLLQFTTARLRRTTEHNDMTNGRSAVACERHAKQKGGAANRRKGAW